MVKENQLKLHNSLTGQKETFEPINQDNVGMYVCGPTVYSNVHLGNVRTFMSFDMIYRYLKFWVTKCVTFVILLMRDI